MDWVEYFKSDDTGALGGDITSDPITVAVNDIITVKWIVEDNTIAALGTTSISNTGTALDWQPIANTGAETSGTSCYVEAWRAKATTAESITITCAGNGTDTRRTSQSVVVHTGAHLTDPVPSANVFSGRNLADVSQSITPTKAGSALWFAAGDWAATNTFAALTDCTIESTHQLGGSYTCCVIRPTTQPRTDASAFTIGETDTGGDISFVAFEVQAVDTSQYARPDADITDGGWISNTNTATDLFSFMDESTRDDTDWIETGISTTGDWSLSPITSVGAGAVIFRYVAGGDAASNLVAHLGVGTAAGSFSEVGAWTEAGAATALAVFAHTVTGTVSDYTKLRCKLEAT